jgi:hypothetical protein
MNQAILLNNEAIYLIQAGRDAKAVEKMEKALLVGKQESSILLNQLGGRQQNDVPLDNSHGMECIHASVSLSKLQDDTFFIYSQGMSIRTDIFSEETSSSKTPNEHLVNTCCAIMIFNLALAYHRRGVLDKPYHNLLVKANAMYCLAEQLSKKVSDRSRAYGFTNFTIQLATVNNMAQIDRFRNVHGHHTSDRLSRLLGVLASLMSSNTYYVTFLDPTFVLGMHLNVIFSTKEANGAAAA